MLINRARFISLFLLLAVVSGSAQAALSHRASLDWFSLQSEHFQIHYHDGEEGPARKVLAMAEKVHRRLTAFIEWQPQGRTEIVLSDEVDYSNGYASPIPSNRMTLFLSAPDDLNSLEDHAGWLELVFIHEYLHILHLDKASGAPKSLRQFFGRFMWLFPNAWQPSWLTEGLATYIETDSERGIGRGQSSYFDMMMRMESLEGIKPLRQVNQPLASWPMGTTPYLYGVFFYNYLAEQYGEEKVRQLVANYSNNIIPFRIGSNARQVLGKDLDTLWNEFSQQMMRRYSAQRDAITLRGESAATALTQSGYFTGPLASDDSGDLYYIAYDAEQRPALMRRDSLGEEERLAEVAYGARLDVHPQAGVVVAQTEVCENAAAYYDLYRYALDGSGKKRLTRCARYRMAAWSPQGDRLVAVHNNLGRNELHLLDQQGERQQVLWRGGEGAVVSYIDWSPDGRQLVASVWRPGNGWDLELFDMEQLQWSRLTESRAIENHPSFSADGKSVLYSADYDGVYNIYRMRLASRQVERLSNVVGGAFHPLQRSADGSLVFVGYARDGFDLYRVDTPVVVDASVAIEPGSSGVPSVEAPAVTTGEVSAYSPFASLRPRWWFPYLDIVADSHAEVGAITSGWDSLQRHIYAVDLEYDVENNNLAGGIDYIYDRWYPIFKLHASNRYLRGYDGSELLVKSRLSRLYQAEVVLPYLSHDSTWAMHLGAGEESEEDEWIATNVLPEAPMVDRIAGVALSYSSADRQPRSVSRADGREVLLVVEDNDIIDGGDYQGQTRSADWKEFIRLGGEHVLGLRLIAGRGDPTVRPFQLGGIADVNYLAALIDSPAVESPFNRRDYSLRGYRENEPALRGTRMNYGALEYRFPLWRLERGFMAPPIGLHQLHGAIFAESGAAWDTGSAPEQYYSSYGAELNSDVVIFYNMMFTLTLGYAHGIEDIGEDQGYLRFGASF